ncbi:3-deoxy-7-phosphoheptulonate synthase [Desulfitispora alkaliphila]|uniref:3-deoxy-7-phosphoheptulonate synthase n=1 Tax=Desulfitispora alkaliphila TaxID=622674 RepID=UPI003D1B435E
MVIKLIPGTSKETIAMISSSIEAKGIKVEVIEGSERTIMGLVGNTALIDVDSLKAFPEVEKVIKISEPFRKANRLWHPENSVIDVGGQLIGGNKLTIIAGPCSVETESQITEVAERVKESGVGFLRGGAYKPRSSPYAFQGLEEKGIELLMHARENTGLPIVSELMSTDMLDRFVEDVDVIQIGARNMQNYDLLKAVGRTRKPILLKRGLSATVEEWLMSAEYIMAGGNNNVILCERGIRTYETSTRNTLDLSAIPVVKKLSHLPIIVDPSHSGGVWWMVEALSRGAIAAGADGLMIEVHNDPINALCDGAQSMKPKKFDRLMGSLKVIANAVGREL